MVAFTEPAVIIPTVIIIVCFVGALLGLGVSCLLIKRARKRHADNMALRLHHHELSLELAQPTIMTRPRGELATTAAVTEGTLRSFFGTVVDEEGVLRSSSSLALAATRVGADTISTSTTATVVSEDSYSNTRPLLLGSGSGGRGGSSTNARSRRVRDEEDVGVSDESDIIRQIHGGGYTSPFVLESPTPPSNHLGVANASNGNTRSGTCPPTTGERGPTVMRRAAPLAARRESLFVSGESERDHSMDTVPSLDNPTPGAMRAEGRASADLRDEHEHDNGNIPSVFGVTSLSSPTAAAAVAQSVPVEITSSSPSHQFPIHQQSPSPLTHLSLSSEPSSNLPTATANTNNDESTNAESIRSDTIHGVAAPTGTTSTTPNNSNGAPNPPAATATTADASPLATTTASPNAGNPPPTPPRRVQIAAGTGPPQIIGGPQPRYVGTPVGPNGEENVVMVLLESEGDVANLTAALNGNTNHTTNNNSGGGGVPIANATSNAAAVVAAAATTPSERVSVRQGYPLVYASRLTHDPSPSAASLIAANAEANGGVAATVLAAMLAANTNNTNTMNTNAATSASPRPANNNNNNNNNTTTNTNAAETNDASANSSRRHFVPARSEIAFAFFPLLSDRARQNSNNTITNNNNNSTPRRLSGGDSSSNAPPPPLPTSSSSSHVSPSATGQSEIRREQESGRGGGGGWGRATRSHLRGGGGGGGGSQSSRGRVRRGNRVVNAFRAGLRFLSGDDDSAISSNGEDERQRQQGQRSAAEGGAQPPTTTAAARQSEQQGGQQATAAVAEQTSAAARIGGLPSNALSTDAPPPASAEEGGAVASVNNENGFGTLLHHSPRSPLMASTGSPRAAADEMTSTSTTGSEVPAFVTRARTLFGYYHSPEGGSSTTSFFMSKDSCSSYHHAWQRLHHAQQQTSLAGPAAINNDNNNNNSTSVPVAVGSPSLVQKDEDPSSFCFGKTQKPPALFNFSFADVSCCSSLVGGGGGGGLASISVSTMTAASQPQQQLKEQQAAGNRQLRTNRNEREFLSGGESVEVVGDNSDFNNRKRTDNAFAGACFANSALNNASSPSPFQQDHTAAAAAVAATAAPTTTFLLGGSRGEDADAVRSFSSSCGANTTATTINTISVAPSRRRKSHGDAFGFLSSESRRSTPQRMRGESKSRSDTIDTLFSCYDASSVNSATAAAAVAAAYESLCSPPSPYDVNRGNAGRAHHMRLRAEDTTNNNGNMSAKDMRRNSPSTLLSIHHGYPYGVTSGEEDAAKEGGRESGAEEEEKDASARRNMNEKSSITNNATCKYTRESHSPFGISSDSGNGVVFDGTPHLRPSPSHDYYALLCSSESEEDLGRRGVSSTMPTMRGAQNEPPVRRTKSTKRESALAVAAAATAAAVEEKEGTTSTRRTTASTRSLLLPPLIPQPSAHAQAQQAQSFPGSPAAFATQDISATGRRAVADCFNSDTTHINISLNSPPNLHLGEGEKNASCVAAAVTAAARTVVGSVCDGHSVFLGLSSSSTCTSTKTADSSSAAAPCGRTDDEQQKASQPLGNRVRASSSLLLLGGSSTAPSSSSSSPLLLLSSSATSGGTRTDGGGGGEANNHSSGSEMQDNNTFNTRNDVLNSLSSPRANNNTNNSDYSGEGRGNICTNSSSNSGGGSGGGSGNSGKRSSFVGCCSPSHTDRNLSTLGGHNNNNSSSTHMTGNNTSITALDPRRSHQQSARDQAKEAVVVGGRRCGQLPHSPLMLRRKGLAPRAVVLTSEGSSIHQARRVAFDAIEYKNSIRAHLAKPE